MSRPQVVIVITARIKSSRLPGKVLEPLAGLTVLEHQVRRALSVGIPVIVAVPDDEPELYDYAIRLPVDRVYAGDPLDVVSRVYHAAKVLRPNIVVRGLPDCPYFDYPTSLKRAMYLAEFGAAEATRSRHPFGRQPVYGTDEPAYSWRMVERMLRDSNSFEREHFGSFVDTHRKCVNILYTPSPPSHLYRDPYRPFRLELDTPEDLMMLQRLVERTGYLASPTTAVSTLERNPELVVLNSGIDEVTGPVTSYVDYAEEHVGALTRSFPVGDGLLFGLDVNRDPVFCKAGVCFLGYSEDGVLVKVSGEKVWGGEVSCQCGAGRSWRYRTS